MEETPWYLGGRLHTGHGASEPIDINALGTSEDEKNGQNKRVAVFSRSYSYPYTTLCLFWGLMGQYRSRLPLDMGSTGFICIAESNLHLLYTSK